MTYTHSYIPLAAVMISLLGTIPITLSKRKPILRESWTLLISLGKFALIASMLPSVLSGQGFVWTFVDVLPGLPIAFRVDAMGMLFALVASFLWICTSFFSFGYLSKLKKHSKTRYYTSFSLAMSATIGVAFAANLLTMYMFYEILSLATYPLVTHDQDCRVRSAGRKYLSYIVGTSIMFALPAVIMTYMAVGSLDFTPGGILAGKASNPMLALIFCLFIAGFAKASIMPFHAWIPAAMVAPAPVSSFLHGVAVVKVGVFSILRVILDIFGPDLLRSLDYGVMLAYFVSFTILVASLVALTQDDLKRRLAYSTVGQLSYIVLGVALLTPHSTQGGILHIVMHAFGKITLFFCSGCIYVATHKRSISEMDGLGKQMPLTYAAFFIGALSIIGLPPMGGFISKWNLLLGTLEANQLPILVILLASSLLNAAYFLPIVYRGFFSNGTNEHVNEFRDVPYYCLVPMCVTALVSFVLFFYHSVFVQLAKIAAGS